MIDAFRNGPEPGSSVFLTALARIAAISGPGRAVRRGLENVLDVLVSNLGYRRASLELHDLPKPNARILLSHGQEQGLDALYSPGPLSTGQVMGTRRALIIQDVRDHPDFIGRPPDELASLSFICVPVTVPDPDGQVEGFEPATPSGVVGALAVDLPRAPQIFLEAHKEFLMVVGAMVGNAALRLRDELDQAKRQTDQPSVDPPAPSKSVPTMPVAVSKSMRLVLRQIAQAAGTPTPILFRGEEGTGKEALAQYLHDQSPRRGRPFLRLGCASQPAEIIEETLFGVQKGERAKAARSRRGIFELAQGGSVLLEDIESLSASAQAAVLRVIQEGVIARLGADKPLAVDVRVFAATQTSLEELVAQGEFLEDLYYAFSVLPIYVPPLRERVADILPLAERFLDEAASRLGKSVRRISTPAIDLLSQYHWPGNIQELENCMERAASLCDEAVVRTYHLPPTLQTGESSDTEPSLSFGEAVAKFEEELLVEALKKAHGNMYQAARDLRESYRVVNYKVKKHGIDPKRFTAGRRG